jgi:prepilin-type processing-associated H-X9-DG protein
VLADVTDEPTPPPDTDGFVLVGNGRTPVAFADGHGTWAEWIPT